MLVDDAVTSAATQPGVIAVPVNRTQLVAIVKAAIWQMFEWEKDKSFAGTKWGIHYSIKVAKIRPLLVRWIGEPGS